MKPLRIILAVFLPLAVWPMRCAAQELPSTIHVERLATVEFRISWTHANAVVEEAAEFSPSPLWRPLSITPVFLDGRYSAILPVLNRQRFYRLRTFPENVLPPDPVDLAPPLIQNGTTDFQAATEFLYSGEEPIQIGLNPEIIETARVAVIRGRVLQRDNTPLPGVTISILRRSEFGLTLTREDGMFDLAVNGGGIRTVKFEADGFCPVQRKVEVPWKDYICLPDVVMIPADPAVTDVTFGINAPPQVARGSVQTDLDGMRQATLFFPEGTCAEMVLPDGTVVPCDGLSIRATEFTVGDNGPAAMPAELPPTSAYTYAVELSADEAVARKASKIQFNQPVHFYLENFLAFPVGMAVPAGFYDREQAVWIASPNGRVIEIASIDGGHAELDTNGDGMADNDETLGITDAEREELAQLFSEGQTLWRVPVTHFSPFDLNWPPAPDDDVIDPLIPEFEELVDSCETEGSIIEVQNQVLRKSVPVVGTPFTLNYSSSRVAGYKKAYSLEIPLIGSTVPDSLKQIFLEVRVAGRVFAESFPPAPEQSTTFTWDGKDAYGRTLQGKQPVTIRLGYQYQAVYREPAEAAASFGLIGATSISVSRFNGTFTIWQERRGLIGHWNARATGLGGWTLSAHHAQDTREAVIHLGTGERQPLQSFENVITTVAGTSGLGGFDGDGGPATRARLSRPNDLTIGEDGSLYIADTSNHRIRRVDPSGRITTVAGIGNNGIFADGIPATEALIRTPMGVDVGPDGSLYIADHRQNRIRRVFPGRDGIVTGEPDEIITTVAGTGAAGTTGDNGLATEAQIQEISSVAAGSDGSVYFAQEFNNVRIRRINPAGIITTVEEVPSVHGIAVAPNGTLYYTEPRFRTLRRISPGGASGVVVGNLGGAWGVGVSPNGQVYVSTMFSRSHKIFRVKGRSLIDFAGTGESGFSGDGGLALNAKMHTPSGIAIAPNGDVFVADSINNVVRRVRRTVGNFAALLVPGPNGQEIFEFDASVRHLKTLDALTGTLLYQFEYNEHGLEKVTDRFGNVTLVDRDANGQPIAIISPFGHRTTLTVDANGLLESVTNPANESIQVKSTANGLLTAIIDPREHSTQYQYDELGLLTEIQDAQQGVTRFARSEITSNNSRSYAVTRTTPMNRVTTYQVEILPNDNQKFSVTFPGGEQSELLRQANGTIVASFADGSSITNQFVPGPRFGMLAPMLSSGLANASPTIRLEQRTTRTVSLSDSEDLLSVQMLTLNNRFNGRNYQLQYETSARSVTSTSPSGREELIVLDDKQNPKSSSISGREPLRFTYDELGRSTAIRLGTGEEERQLSFVYGSNGFVRQVNDLMDRTIDLERDGAGRVTKFVLPDAREVQFQWDAGGNLTAITPAGRPAHRFTYNEISLPVRYSPPDIGLPSQDTTYTYNLDRQLTRIMRPDGEAVELSYETGAGCDCGQLAQVVYEEGTITYSYDPTTSQLASITTPKGNLLSYQYDEALLEGVAWSGEVTGRVDYAYNNDFQITSVSVNGSEEIAFGHDQDGRVTQAGELSLSWDPATQQIRDATLGSVFSTWTYNEFGELAGYEVLIDNTPLFSNVYQRDKLGRITELTETLDGTTTSYQFRYDLGDRLTEVSKNGTVSSTYVYDENSNRISRTTPAGTMNAGHDAQDRMLNMGSTEYTYTANGELRTKSANDQTTAYEYDALGNLLEATLPDGTLVEYVMDGQNRRIGKRVNGLLVQGFLYEDWLKPVAELDGENNVVSRFVYASQMNVPDYMIKDGATYRIITDHLASPRLVVEVATGEIVQQLNYDELGKVTLDTNPGFQPFGFAGGLYDTHTGLVRFGARDYDGETGRWTTKDPLQFGGGDANLYGYGFGDPVNERDPFGLLSGFCESIATCAMTRDEESFLKGDLSKSDLMGGYKARAVGVLTGVAGVGIELAAFSLASRLFAGTVGFCDATAPTIAMINMQTPEAARRFIDFMNQQMTLRGGSFGSPDAFLAVWNMAVARFGDLSKYIP